jgi:polyhydroxyalkanoate synthesis regulator phasin
MLMPPRTPFIVAEQMIIEYLNKQNRPFSAQLLQTSLAQHGITKTQCTKALDKLAQENAITEGAFGKTKIYWRIQEVLAPDSDAADADAATSTGPSLDEEITQLTSQISALQRQVHEIESRMMWHLTLMY